MQAEVTRDGTANDLATTVGADCENAVLTITDGIAALRLIWDSIANGSANDLSRIEQALDFTLKPMEKAGAELVNKLDGRRQVEVA